MKLIKRGLCLILVVLSIVALDGCSQSNSAASTQTLPPAKEEKAVGLIISAAASLKDAMKEIKQIYSQEKTSVALTYNFGASGSLQQQIEQGAPADIFISAAAAQMNVLKDKGLILEDTNKMLLENKVVLIVPKDSTSVTSFEDLAGDKIKKVALGEPASVPAGKYANEVLTKLNILDKVQPKVVQAKDVREVLTWVETGNADAGVVYETDAKVSDKVKIAAAAPEKSHSPVVYPAAVIKDSKNIDAAKEFLQFLSGDKAKAVFEKFGFHTVSQ